MGRKKKLINKTDIPQYAVERFARCVFDDIRAAYADQEVQAEFARWQAQRAELNTKKKRAAVVNRSLSSRQMKKQKCLSRISEMRSWFSFKQLPVSCGK